MLSALGMHLEPVRTVLKNEVCEVNVYTDAKSGAGRLYTVNTIHSPALTRELAGRVAVGDLFGKCADFVGSFMHRNTLNLVFNYQQERHITSSDIIYSAAFPKRKEIATAFVTALAETGIDGDVGTLLITEENVNISGSRVYLNYFLDFGKLPESEGRTRFFNSTAMFAFILLSWGYSERYDGNVDLYPNTLRLMQKKAMSGNFRSFSQVIAFIRDLPDAPQEQRRGITRIFDGIDAVRRALTGNATRTFMTIVVVATLVFLVYQLGIRWSARAQTDRNSVYVGMENIGEVYLGERYY